MKDKKDFVRRNEQVRHHQVLLIHEGQKLGIFSSRDAYYRAKDMGLDLVEVSPQARPPVCVIMDYGKFQYEQNKKKKKTAGNDEKEISFRYMIDENDLRTKMNQAKGFIAKGDRVKITVKFKARENAHKDQGFAIIQSALKMLDGVVTVEKAPSFEGQNLVAKVVPLQK